MRELLRHPQFRRLYAGAALSVFGDSALQVVIAIWIKDLTNSNGAAALAFLGLAVPALFSPLLGTLVDRFPRRAVLITNDLVTGAGALGLLLVHDRGQIWLLYAFSLLYGASQQIVVSARSGLLTSMLPSELLAGANGLLESTRQGMRLVGPLAGAAVYAAAGGHAVAVVDAASFAASAGALALVTTPDIARVRRGRPGLEELTAGLRHMMAEPVLRMLVLVGFCFGGCVGLTEVIPIALVDQGLHRPPEFLGVLATFSGAGAIVGGLSASRLIARLGEVPVFAMTFAAFAGGLLLRATALLLPAVAGTSLSGAGLACATITYFTTVQRRTDVALQGRAFAVVESTFALPYTVSIGLGAALVTVVDFRVLCIAAGAGVLMLSAYALRFRALTRQLVAAGSDPG
jgi:MFS family permease